MKRLTTIGILLVILSLILSIFLAGCAEEAPMHPGEAEKKAEEAKQQMPEIGEATPEKAEEPDEEEAETEEVEAEPEPEEEAVPEEEPAPEEKVTEVTEETEMPEQELEPLGTRYYGDEPEQADEDVPEMEDQIIVNLLEDKTMDQGNLTIDAGTTVTYKNKDSWPHALAVETGKGYDAVRHAENRLEAGEVWSYKFTEQGKFLVRDMFSGTMRHYVTVE